MINNISEISFGSPIQTLDPIIVESEDINNINTIEIKQFDEIYYPHYRENNTFIVKDALFQMLVNDLIEYLKTCQSSNEIRVGYIIYSKLVLSSSKMNNILNLLMQKINPNIRVQSMWNIVSSYKGPIQTATEIENVDFDKIKIKILIKPNDKDIAIQKLAEINLNYMKRNVKKINDYLINYKD